MSNTVQRMKSGRIVVHLGTGNGTINAPRCITLASAKYIAEHQFPFGSFNRRNNIIAEFRRIRNSTPIRLADRFKTK